MASNLKAMEEWPAVQELSNFGFEIGEADYLVKVQGGNATYIFTRTRKGSRMPRDMEDPVELQVADERNRAFLFLQFASVKDLIRAFGRTLPKV